MQTFKLFLKVFTLAPRLKTWCELNCIYCTLAIITRSWLKSALEYYRYMCWYIHHTNDKNETLPKESLIQNQFLKHRKAGLCSPDKYHFTFVWLPTLVFSVSFWQRFLKQQRKWIAMWKIMTLTLFQRFS